MFFRLFTHCSARVSELVIVLNDSRCERIGNWEDLPNFERGQSVGARSAGTFVTKTATVLGVSRATVSKVMSAYTNHGEDDISDEQQWAKINTDRKK
jgi:hypothetical protein